MIIHKKVLNLAKVCCDEGGARFPLEHIKVNKDESVVTNGIMLLRVKNDNQDKLYDFPGDPANNNETIFLNQKTCKKLAQILPKKVKLPVLEYFVSKLENKVITLTSNDLENETVIKQSDPEVQYPDIDLITPKSPTKATVTLGVARLQQLLGAVTKLSDKDTITFTIHERDNEPVGVKVDENIYGLIMRCKE